MFVHRYLPALVLCGVIVQAQQPVEPPPGVIEPAAPSTPQAPAPPVVPAPGAAQAPAPPVIPAPGVIARPQGRPVGAPVAADKGNLPNLGDTKIVEDIVEPKLSGTALAGLYRKYTGRRVIVAQAATTAEFSFIQEASPQDPLTYSEAAELLKKAAVIENFVFVPDDQMPNVDILTLSTGGIRPTSRGVEVFNEEDQLPDGDEVISYVMTLSYIKPAEAVNTFTQIIGQFGAYGSIAAVPNAAAVVITENTSLIRKLIDLKEEIDKPSSQVATRFIPVRFADVTEIAEVLNELLNSQQQSQTTAGIQRANVAQPQPAGLPQGAVPGAESASGETTPIQIIPDPRTNRIFAMGRPVDLLFVEGLVREFDVETSEKNFLRRKLRFLKVYEFLPIAGDALTRAFSGSADGASAAGGSAGAAGGSGSSRNSSTQNRSSGFGSNSRSGGSNSNSSFGSSSSFGGSNSGFGGSGGGSGAGAGSVLQAPNESTAPESLLVGRTLIVADNITNSIVVQGPPAALEIVERLLEQLDVKADQVMISTVFGQLSLGNTTRTGVDWLMLFQGNDNGSGLAGSLVNGARLVFDPASINEFRGVGSNVDGDVTTAGFPAGQGLSLYGKIGTDIAAYVDLLSTSTDFTVLSRPSIFTANNQVGTISSGRRIAVPTNSFNSGSTGQSTNIEYRDVVLKLEVVPLVNSEKEITMQIALVSDDVIGTQTIEGIGEVPIIGTREILTTVTVPNNETVVLGGLISENDQKAVNGIPVLSDIPYLGRLFSSNTDTTDRDELLVFIQPSIVTDRSSMDFVQADTDSRYNVSQRAREYAEGPGVLPPNGSIQSGSRAGAVQRTSNGVDPATGTILKPTLRPVHRR